MNDQAVQEYLETLCSQAVAANCRYTVLLSGSPVWGQNCAQVFTRTRGECEIIWLGPDAPAGVSHKTQVKPAYIIGQEYDFAVMDLHAQFNVNVFAAVSGTVRGGGLLLLLIPAWDQWPVSYGLGQDVRGGRFLELFRQHVMRDEQVVLLQQNRVLPPIPAMISTLPVVPPPSVVYASSDQEAAVHAIISVAHGHRRRPLVITADRGRGKSAALGIAAAQLIQSGIGPMAITGPGGDAVAMAFKHAQALLSGCSYGAGRLSFNDSTLSFVPVDELLRTRPTARVLFIDEAASLPVAQLQALTRHYSRVVLASTIHGYEGTGMGFAVHFFGYLDQTHAGWRSLEIQTPVRWCRNDPLEKFCFQALLLDADYQVPPLERVTPPASVAMEQMSQDMLMAKPEDLRQLFGLLLFAHHRTRPSDLQSMLDADDIRIFVMRCAGQIVAAVLVRLEAALPVEYVTPVFRGERRLRGSITAQILVAQLGVRTAGTLSYARIMRIAVMPQLQRQGWGRQILAGLQQWVCGRDLDALSVSYGATPELMAFWASMAYQTVYAGMSKDHVSGYHSLTMLLPCTTRATAVVESAQHRLSALLNVLIFRELEDLPADIWMSIQQQIKQKLEQESWSDEDRQEVDAFVHGQRGVAGTQPLLLRLLTRLTGNHDWQRILSGEERELLVAKVVKGRSWPGICSTLGYVGKRDAQSRLRAAVGKVAAAIGLAKD